MKRVHALKHGSRSPISLTHHDAQGTAGWVTGLPAGSPGKALHNREQAYPNQLTETSIQSPYHRWILSAALGLIWCRACWHSTG